MSRKRIIIIAVIGLIILWVYLQYGRDVEVCNSILSSSNEGYGEETTVIANKLYIRDREAYARELVERHIENSFPEIRFSYDSNGFPSELHISVYMNKAAWKLKTPAFRIDYEQDCETHKQYNIKDNPEKFHLKIQGTALETKSTVPFYFGKVRNNDI